MNTIQRAVLENGSEETGMGRFFSSTNIKRFRKLASDETGTAERSRVLEALTAEWGAFIRENRRRGVARSGRTRVKARSADGACGREKSRVTPGAVVLSNGHQSF
jgi:hypothetical protein